MKDFIQLWIIGYGRPRLFVDDLPDKPAPDWGFYAQVIRSLMASLLLYLPLTMLGRVPPTPSYLTIFSTEYYYKTLIFLTPLVFFLEWLVGSSVIHLLIRLFNRSSKMDQILNLTGMAGLVIAAFLVFWDWFWFLTGYGNQYLLGISHLLIDIWYIVLVMMGLKKTLDIPYLMGFGLILISFVFTFPLAILFMRAPF